MSATLEKDKDSATMACLLPGTRVRIQDAIRVGNASRSESGRESLDGQKHAAVQVHTIPENGTIRYIEIRCGCGQVIRLRCEYEAAS